MSLVDVWPEVTLSSADYFGLEVEIEVPPFNQAAYDSTLQQLQQRQAKLKDYALDYKASESDTLPSKDYALDYKASEGDTLLAKLKDYVLDYKASEGDTLLFDTMAHPPSAPHSFFFGLQAKLKDQALDYKAKLKDYALDYKASEGDTLLVDMTGYEQLEDGSKGEELKQASGAQLTVELLPGRFMPFFFVCCFPAASCRDWWRDCSVRRQGM
ncbi:hypothetical protein T492DRAFT_840971 [Pavlovales sp. CCMP2436]|nr:hypothetical protein T492DRAFT_840971 [Pavlovales sp. CCMP2436]